MGIMGYPKGIPPPPGGGGGGGGSTFHAKVVGTILAVPYLVIVVYKHKTLIAFP